MYRSAPNEIIVDGGSKCICFWYDIDGEERYIQCFGGET